MDHQLTNRAWSSPLDPSAMVVMTAPIRVMSRRLPTFMICVATADPAAGIVINVNGMTL